MNVGMRHLHGTSEITSFKSCYLIDHLRYYIMSPYVTYSGALYPGVVDIPVTWSTAIMSLFTNGFPCFKTLETFRKAVRILA